jgi:predicted alternative tryptophan synthase beta-subunit
VHADDRFAKVPQHVKALVAQFQAQLVFTLRAETPVAFIASGKCRAFAQLLNLGFRMDFERNHCGSPKLEMHALCHDFLPSNVAGNRVRGVGSPTTA